MEKTTLYIHRNQDELESYPNDECRIVTFVNGNQDIMNIIKNLIKEKL